MSAGAGLWILKFMVCGTRLETAQFSVYFIMPCRLRTSVRNSHFVKTNHSLNTTSESIGNPTVLFTFASKQSRHQFEMEFCPWAVYFLRIKTGKKNKKNYGKSDAIDTFEHEFGIKLVLVLSFIKG